jgi:hypothetical protein
MALFWLFLGIALGIGICYLFLSRTVRQPPALPAATIRLTHGGSNFSVEGVSLMANLKNTDQIHGKLSFKNRLGGPAKPEAGSVRIAGSNDDAFTVTSPDPSVGDGTDETTFLVKGNPNAPGDSTSVGIVSADWDGDQGEGVSAHHAEAAINVTPADAEVGELELGAAEPQS